MQTYAICNDSNGNTYTLGDFAHNANCLGENLNDSSGVYFILKQNTEGDKIFVKNLGGLKRSSFGNIQVCKNGDIVLGLTYESDFYLNGSPIASSAKISGIIVKLDSSFNLKWFRTFPAGSVSYINKLLIDKQENIYAEIPFIGELSINNKTYLQKKEYGTAFVKLSPLGNFLWTHHYYSDYVMVNKGFGIETKCDTCSDNIFVFGNVSGDSIFIDSVLQTVHKRKFGTVLFVGILDESGKILQTKFLDEGIRNITDINFYKNKIYFAGSYFDTVNWNGNQTNSIRTSLYIGELNHQADLIDFKDLKSSESIYLYGFKTSPQFGFVLSGSSYDSFFLQTKSLKLARNGDVISFIATFNDSLNLDKCQFINVNAYGNYSLRALNIFKDQITGAAYFKGTCHFENQNSTSTNSAISVFQTNLKDSGPSNIDSYLTTAFSVSAKPNPFDNEFIITFSKPVLSTSLTLINSIGQVCNDIEISQVNNKEVAINTHGLPPGLYTILYSTVGNIQGVYKLIKIGE